ncbi:MAG: ABC transporter ATP-binding protein [Erysipelotrichaceae bacterium]|nr:ABC transporter ATP-binding protein [Erysipelotrichaceae bacterium]
MAITLNNISKSFDGRKVLDDFSYRFEDGKMYLLKGPSGIGKTTLLNIIMSLISPDQGTVDTSDRFSALFQQYRLLEYYDVKTNLQLVSGRSDLKQVVCELLPEEAFDQPVYQLSGGMKQRVCIIRALIAQSDTVIMDEPFNGLDEKNIGIILDFIRKHLNGRTLIISTHQFEFLKDFNMNVIEL